MNNLDRLRLLENTLANTNVETIENLGMLANDIESLCFTLDDVSDEFSTRFSKLWAALEVVAVRHQELGTDLTQLEVKDLGDMKRDLHNQTKREIFNRTGQ